MTASGADDSIRDRRISEPWMVPEGGRPSDLFAQLDLWPREAGTKRASTGTKIIESPRDLVHLVETQQYDLLLLNSETPESNDINLLDEVKSRQSGMPTIVIESEPSHEFQPIAASPEAVYMISTPIPDRQFVSVVRDAIEN